MRTQSAQGVYWPQAVQIIFVFVILMLVGCGHEKRIRRAVEVSSVSLPACPSAVPPIPDEAANEGRYGTVLVGYSVEADGRVDQIELEDPRASPLLFSAVKQWLERCRATDEGRLRAMRISELFSFPPPEAPAVEETPVSLDEGSAAISRPERSPKCTPDRPPPVLPSKGTLDVEYVVHSNGRVGNVNLKGGNAPAALFKTIRIWLQSCPYAPAIRDGKPVAVTVVEPFSFKGE